ncbi:hypothetical protein [Mobilicoccus pelagius]|uniref:Uncharacterized protein n=1 Tax=Mobilicoccus pelagius NBRC 104925 TaxID=1089455 RepID=H5USJ1_9MICO|nr:hypothetical protein [Mobilicoccus pelagius]GAB48699.1 hypothetical protein MOPEL_078_00880 [Mobilicoccus pelagius NBRC 104925]
MSPSSLIFVAVVAVWAAYLVVDTSRRREYLATARTVERFSASMRVLQRRAVRRESAEAFEASSAPMRSTSSVLLHRPQPSRAAIEARAARAGATVAPARTGGAAALADRQRAAARLRRARVLAAVTLLVLVTTLVTGAFAILGHLAWSTPVMGTATTGLLFVLMRRNAVAARRSGPRPSRPAAPARRRTGAATTTTGHGGTTDADSGTDVLTTAQADVPFDYARVVEPSITAEHAYAQRVAARAEDADLLDEAAWAPVPVPPPTYTLKARAERPLPPPLEVEEIPVPVDEEWEDLDALAYGRAAGQ